MRRVCGVDQEWRKVRQRAGLQELSLSPPSLTKMGGSTHIFSSPQGPDSPAEVKGLPKIFMDMWAYPRGQARECSPSPFALLTSATSSLIEKNIIQIKLKK